MSIADVDVPGVLSRLGIDARRRRRELWARCPFHADRTPSWSIRDDPGRPDRHGLWKCLGACPEGQNSGSVVSLVLRLLGLRTREEAWRWIKTGSARARVRLSVEVEESPPPRAFALPDGVRVAPVAEWVRPARDYLASRGVPPEQAERWGLGYAADGRLRGRVVIPIRDSSGDLVSYTARLFAGAGRKFLEPDEREGADKSAVFGEERWPDERDLVVLTEAAFDALAVERETGLPFGAIYGSEILPGHLARLRDFRRVVVASDPDAAGEKFWRAARAAFSRWADVSRADLPEGLDAAELVRRSPGELARRVAAALRDPDRRDLPG